MLERVVLFLHKFQEKEHVHEGDIRHGPRGNIIMKWKPRLKAN